MAVTVTPEKPAVDHFGRAVIDASGAPREDRFDLGPRKVEEHELSPQEFVLYERLHPRKSVASHPEVVWRAEVAEDAMQALRRQFGQLRTGLRSCGLRREGNRSRLESR